MSREESRKKIAENFKEIGIYDLGVLVEVKGSYLIENNLVQEWADQRGIDPQTITAEWSDHIRLIQADLLGLLDFVKSV